MRNKISLFILVLFTTIIGITAAQAEPSVSGMIAISSTLKSIIISPSTTTTLTIGGSQSFSATAIDQNNNPMTGIEVSWTVSNFAVGSVIPTNGRTNVTGSATTTFTAIGAGSALVNARNGSFTATAMVTVEKVPSSITNLHSTSGPTWLNFTWTNPLDPDFNQTILYLNGAFFRNVAAPRASYNITGLIPDTQYGLCTHTMDTSGHINTTWKNASARTLPSSDNSPPAITFIPPTDPNNTILTTRNWTFINVSLSESGFAWLELNSVNESMSGAGPNWHINKTGLGNGIYTYRVWANDSAGNVGVSKIRVIEILIPSLKGDLNGNGESADAGDLVLMKRASIGEIQADSRYDLNDNGQNADAGDLVLMKRASIGEIKL